MDRAPSYGVALRVTTSATPSTSAYAEHELGKTFWQADLERRFAMFRNAIHTHIITSHCAAPLLIETATNSGRTGLIMEIGDGETYTYRGHLFFDLIKTTAIRLALAMSYGLRKKDVAAVAFLLFRGPQCD
jgi:hypothetical protein